jgi:uncharacterized protein YdeI (YjbR/CyaY-like superfamily)
MPSLDPRIDAYIAKAPEFARPILAHLREAVHAGCPDVEETMKWSSPHFMYKGMLCGMSAFKQHCVFGFWKGKLVLDVAAEKAQSAGGHFGRIESVRDLPPKKEIVRLVKEAARLNDEGVKAPVHRKSKGPRPDLPVPPALTAALVGNRKARETFEGFSPSHRREYSEWIGEAKSEETRTRRVAQAIEWMAEGKSRNWKYAKR